MPRIPTYRQKKLPSTNIGAAPLNPAAANQAGGAIGQGLSALGKGIGDVGQALATIEKQKQAIRDDAAVADTISAEKEFARQTELEYENKVYSDPKDIAADRKGMLTRIGDFRASQSGSMSQRAFAEYENRSKIGQDTYHRRFESAIYKSEVSFAQSQAGVRLGTAYQVLYDPASSAQQKADAQASIDSVKDGFKEYFDPFTLAATDVQSEYQAIIDNGGSKEQALKVIDDAAKEKRITPDQKHTMSNRLDSYAAGRVKTAKDKIKLTTNQAYADLSNRIANEGISFDDIDQSNLLKADKEKWTGENNPFSKGEDEIQGYLEGSYLDSPIETTQDGMIAAFGAVYDSQTLKKTPREAYDELLQSRYIEQDMTDEQFRWALNKIENPYPPHLIEDIHAIVKSNFEDFNGWIKQKKDQENNVKTNESLLTWVDDLIKRDAVPKFDFKKKMFAQSSQYRVGNDRWYDIGQVIEQGGREWEVVGFDEDGEEIVEEIR